MARRADLPEVHKSLNGLTVCYNKNTSLPFSVFNPSTALAPNAMASSLPFFILQLFTANVVYRIFFYATNFLRLPHFVAQILCGVLLGPSVMGETSFVKNYVFPYRYVMVLETFANLALIYYMFLLGLEIDFSVIKRYGSKALSISVAGAVVTFFTALLIFVFVLRSTSGVFSEEVLKSMFWATALGATSFSDLAEILSDLKLFRTEIGKTAMSAAIITDLFTWLQFILIISIFTKNNQYKVLALTTILGFILISWFLARPILSWAISKATKETNQLNESHIWFVFIGVVLFGIITDIFGAHSIMGAFIFGIIMPERHVIKDMIKEKLDDFVSSLLMPLFYVLSGLRTDFKYLMMNQKMLLLFFIVFGGCVAKIISTYFIAIIYGISSKDGIALGFLLNMKGILSLIIINAGRDMKVLDSQTFALMVLVLLLMSCLTKPFLYMSYKVKKGMVEYKLKTIERIKRDAEFRIIACIYNLHNVSGITDLLLTSNPTPQSAICIFAIHLVEFTGPTAASLLIMNDEHKTNSSDDFNIYYSDINSESDYITKAFTFFEKENQFVKAHTITVVSPFDTMHKDICSLAEEKHAGFIIVPFHKQTNDTDTSEDKNLDFENVIKNVLENAPCSVGILVDKGVNVNITRTDSQQSGRDHSFRRYVTRNNIILKKHILMIFLGGPDDREALMYAWRMTGDPNVSLTVVRFEMNTDVAALTWQKEKEKDDEVLYEFIFKSMNDYSITYKETVVNDGLEIVRAIKQVEDHYDLCITGRGEKEKSPLLNGFSDWDTSLELGTIGDALISSTFLSQASVLVVQQYSSSHQVESLVTPDTM